MAYVNWKIKGPKIGGCSCDYGCPCEFNGRPTLGDLCEGMEAMRIDEGWFGEGPDQVRLDGLIIGARFRWPGPVHEGRGIAQGFIDSRATPDQVKALFTILGGEEQEPTTVFNIYGSTIEKELDPIFAAIDFAIDMPARTAHFKIDGVVDFRAQPIKNPVTGLDHAAKIVLPEGFEFRTAEMASATFHGEDEALGMSRADKYAALFYAAYGPYGIIDDETTAGTTAAMAA